MFAISQFLCVSSVEELNATHKIAISVFSEYLSPYFLSYPLYTFVSLALESTMD